MTAGNRRLLDQLDGILFDLDGTLLDTAPDLVRALNQVCNENDVAPPPYDSAASNVSNGAIGLTRLAFPNHSDAAHQTLCARLVEVYKENICVDTRPYPGMLELLQHLDANPEPSSLAARAASARTRAAPRQDLPGFGAIAAHGLATKFTQ